VAVIQYTLTPGGSSTVHIYTQTIHRTTQLIREECGPYPVFASYTLAFALQQEKAGKTLSQGRGSVIDGNMCVFIFDIHEVYFVLKLSREMA
jgi:hypothetical protein